MNDRVTPAGVRTFVTGGHGLAAHRGSRAAGSSPELLGGELHVPRRQAQIPDVALRASQAREGRAILDGSRKNSSISTLKKSMKKIVPTPFLNT